MYSKLWLRKGKKSTFVRDVDTPVPTDQSIPGNVFICWPPLNSPACEHLMPLALPAFEAGSCNHSFKLWSIVLQQFIDKARCGFRAWVTQVCSTAVSSSHCWFEDLKCGLCRSARNYLSSCPAFFAWEEKIKYQPF